MTSKCKCTCSTCKVRRWLKKIGQKRRELQIWQTEKCMEEATTGDRRWSRQERGYSSTGTRSLSGKCSFSSECAGVMLLAFLELLQIPVIVTERDEGFWYLYWKIRYRKRSSSKMSLADCYGQCFKLIAIPQSLNVFKGRWGYMTAIQREMINITSYVYKLFFAYSTSHANISRRSSCVFYWSLATCFNS